MTPVCADQQGSMVLNNLAHLPTVDTWEEHLRTALQGLGVLLTVATIALALFLQWGLLRLRRPRLTLSISGDIRDEDWVCLDFEDRCELYLRLRVHNKRKKVTAHNTEILLLRVQRPQGGEAAPVVPSRQLAWADTPDERLAIPSGTWRRVDVLKLTHSQQPGGAASLIPALKEYEPRFRARRVTWFSLIRPRSSNETSPRPTPGGVAPQYATDRDVLRERGRYLFDLAITADEVEAKRWRLSFTYTPAPAASAIDLVPQISDVELVQIPEGRI